MSYPIKENVSGQAFFERLANIQRHRRIQRGAVKAESILTSIKLNIEQILNARKGHSQSAPDLGLLDFNDATHTNNDVMTEIKRAIRDCILNYEPRINNVRVELKSTQYSTMNLEIRVFADVDLHGCAEGIAIDILYDRNKRYQVR